MEAIRMIEVQQLAKCGKLDCLKGCCDNLELVKSVLENTTPRDLAFIRSVLCGCEISQPQSAPEDINHCFETAANWVLANRDIISTLLSAAAVLMAVDPATLDLAVFTEALNIMLENAQPGSKDPSVLQKMANAVCIVIDKVNDITLWLENHTVPDSLKGLVNTLNKVNPIMDLAVACCGAPQLVPQTGTATPAPGLPPTIGGTGNPTPNGGPAPQPPPDVTPVINTAPPPPPPTIGGGGSGSCGGGAVL